MIENINGKRIYTVSNAATSLSECFTEVLFVTMLPKKVISVSKKPENP